MSISLSEQDQERYNELVFQSRLIPQTVVLSGHANGYIGYRKGMKVVVADGVEFCGRKYLMADFNAYLDHNMHILAKLDEPVWVGKWLLENSNNLSKIEYIDRGRCIIDRRKSPKPYCGMVVTNV